MTLKGGSSGACAACKYQRRRCASDCQLAPYFPADNPKMFQNAHKLFGVSNILKILKKLDESQKSEAMRSIIFQSCVRERFPIHGCLGYIQNLQYMIWIAEEELRMVNAQLELYRTNNINAHNQNQILELNDHGGTSHLDLGMAPPINNSYGNATLPFFNALPLSQPMQQQVSYSYSCSDVNGYSSAYTDSKENAANINNNNYNSTYWVQHPYASFHNNDNNNNNNDGAIAIQTQLLPSQPLAAQHESVLQDYDENHLFFDGIGDRQSYIDSKEAYESSSEESLKDTTQSVECVAENELNTCFTLTSVN